MTMIEVRGSNTVSGRLNIAAISAANVESDAQTMTSMQIDHESVLLMHTVEPLYKGHCE